MDILIKNIGGLPEDGDLTLTITPKGEIILGGCIFTHNFGKEVKAVALPSHGRLGDLDEISNKLLGKGLTRFFVREKRYLTIGDARKIIENAPVIVEASE